MGEPVHPVLRRLRAEELVRLRSSSDERRYVASQRAGRIDANPHQIDAVIFALRRLREGGCILADEVGLGKTIEAGLVMAQLRAEGARRILLIVPKPLAGQWRQELFSLFGISAKEGRAEAGAFDGEGVFIVGREAAGTPGVSGLIASSAAFDLCVIDEAHELFAGIHRRYDKSGLEKHDSGYAKTAARVRELIDGTPVLLLTATPMQNSLTELWSLVQYVDPSGTLLGDLATFRAVFTGSDDRHLAPGQGRELRRRLEQVVQRTLRRQAQEFLDKPFVGRAARTYEFTMSPEERALYDDVTRYLLRPGLQAFRGSHRSLLLLGFHRRMASSKAALAASLLNVETRLERMLREGRLDDGDATALATAEDLDDEELLEALAAEEHDDGTLDREAAKVELEEVRGLRERADGLGVDAKMRAVIAATRAAIADDEGGGKAVLFTESRKTQEYVCEQLVQAGVVSREEITLFSGDNTGERAAAALERWESEIEWANASEKPSRSVAVRLALVHEFHTRTKVLIATEAGAKGLNLQFCNVLVNVDLPWNPQRIEQRIGRCHRYGQKRDVTVVNFLATDNAAQRLTFEILSQKLELFGEVMGASDAVLSSASGAPREALTSALGDAFEKDLTRIYREARSAEEIEARLSALRDSTAERRRAFEEEHARTHSLIEELDESVRQAFSQIAERLPGELAALDEDLERVVCGYLDVLGVAYEIREEDGRSLRIAECEPFPQGRMIRLGRARDDEEALHLAHPLVKAAVEEARAATAGRIRVRYADAPADAGRLLVLKIRYSGFEPRERLLPLAFAAEGDALRPLGIEDARALLSRAPLEGAGDSSVPEDPLTIDEEIEALIFADRASSEVPTRAQFAVAMERIERYVADRVLVLERERDLRSERAEAARGERDAAIGADARTRAEKKVQRAEDHIDALDATLETLRAGDDERYRRQRDLAHTRRYEPPAHSIVLDIEWSR